MQQRKREIQVGAAFVLSLIVLVAGILWFKNYKFGAARAEIVVEFPNTSGLMRGDPVEVRGVPSGKVESIRYEEGKALVILQLDEHVELYPESRFTIENVGIMGQKLVSIEPGTGRQPIEPEGYVFHGTYQPGIPEFVAQMGDVLDTFQSLATRLDSLMAAVSEGGEGRLSRILTNTDSITTELAGFLRANSEDLSRSVRNLDLAMADLHRMLQGREGQVDQALDAVITSSARLDSALAALETSSRTAERILAGVEDGQGTVGRLVEDEQLYRELTATVQEARTLVADIKANPKKYVKFSIF